jgi:hypothetical protein
LPPEGKKIYDYIKNHGNGQDDKDLIDAINYSLDNEGCLLNTTLMKKMSKAKDKKSTYLRVPFGFDANDIGQPGQPLVLEIWPKGHYSPVHNHGNALAIIKLLSGTLKSEWYNPLSDNYYEKPEIIKSSYLYASNITWMTSCYYQTHKLINIRNDIAAVSIQAYSHVESQSEDDYLEYFNFILPPSPQLIKFYPNADFKNLTEFENTILNEYKMGKCKYSVKLYNNGKYVGEFKNDVRHGQGTYTVPNESVFSGEFKNDKVNGQGTINYFDGTKYVGQFKDDFFNGQGTYIEPDGKKYVGEFKDGLKHGKGTTYLVSGGKFVGEFKNNKADGKATLTAPDGSTHILEFKNGVRVNK